MKVMGRWSSDAFLHYLRKHAQILTPFIQANPEAHESFLQFIISPSLPAWMMVMNFPIATLPTHPAQTR
jgi:hypothetical protein